MLRAGKVTTVLKITLSDPCGIEIAGLAGADAVWLCTEHRIRKSGQTGALKVVAARKRIGAAARKHGKFAMVPGPMAPLRELLAEGCGMVGCASDVFGLGTYFPERIAAMRRQADENAAEQYPGRSLYA